MVAVSKLDLGLRNLKILKRWSLWKLSFRKIAVLKITPVLQLEFARLGRYIKMATARQLLIRKSAYNAENVSGIAQWEQFKPQSSIFKSLWRKRKTALAKSKALPRPLNAIGAICNLRWLLVNEMFIRCWVALIVTPYFYPKLGRFWCLRHHFGYLRDRVIKSYSNSLKSK